MKLKKHLQYCIAFVLLSYGKSYAQINVHILPTSSNIINIESIWNLSITNQNELPSTIQLKALISDKNSEPVLEIVSRPIHLALGTFFLTNSQIETDNITYLNSKYRNMVGNSGVLPSGLYNICITAIAPSSKLESNTDCKEIGNINFSSPSLISPTNGDNIEAPLLLSWTPPRPFPLNTKISYSLSIAEMLPGQTPEEALYTNPLWRKENNLENTSFLYPSEAKSLQRGNSYAWQIEAFNNGNSVGKTEIWKFYYGKKDSQSPIKANYCFALMNKNAYSGYYLAIGELPFSLDKYFTDQNFKAIFFDDSHKEISIPHLKIKKVDDGNDYIINLSEYGQFQNNSFYYFEIYSENNKRYYLKFKYKE